MAAATIPFASVGSFICIVPAAPATMDETGWEALTGWIEIGEVEEIGEYGAENSVLTRTPLKSGVVQKLKGGTDFGTMPLQMAMVPGDVGHVALNAGRESSAPVSVQVNFQDGTKEYFRALVTSYKKTIGSSEGFTAASTMLDITSATTMVAP